MILTAITITIHFHNATLFTQIICAHAPVRCQACYIEITDVLVVAAAHVIAGPAGGHLQLADV